MSRNVQEPAKVVGEISQNIYGVSTAAEEMIKVSSHNELSKLAVDFQGQISKLII